MCPTVPGDRHWRIWPQISAARLAIPSPVELARGHGAGIGRDTNQYAKSAAPLTHIPLLIARWTTGDSSVLCPLIDLPPVTVCGP